MLSALAFIEIVVEYLKSNVDSGKRIVSCCTPKSLLCLSDCITEIRNLVIVRPAQTKLETFRWKVPPIGRLQRVKIVGLRSIEHLESITNSN